MVDVRGEQAADAGERHRQRRVAAIARTAATLASQGSLPTILDALAAEVLQTDALAAVQIVTLDATGRQLRIMGSAGFGHWPDFFDRLMECRRRGAALRMLDAFGQTEPVLVWHRWSIISGDPASSPAPAPSPRSGTPKRRPWPWWCPRACPLPGSRLPVRSVPR